MADLYARRRAYLSPRGDLRGDEYPSLSLKLTMKQLLDLCVTMTIVSAIIGLGMLLLPLWPVFLTLIILIGAGTILVRGVLGLLDNQE